MAAMKRRPDPITLEFVLLLFLLGIPMAYFMLQAVLALVGL